MSATAQIHFFPPSPDLAPYIKSFYLFEAPNAGVPQLVPAWTKSVIVLQYGDPIHSSVGGEVNTVNEVSLNGLITQPYRFTSVGRTIRLLYIEMTNIGLNAMFRENAQAFVDTTIDGFDVIPAQKRRQICDALSETRDLEKKIVYVEDFFRGFLPNPLTLWRLRNVTAALEIIEKRKGNIAMRELARQLSISERQLQRQFHEATGLKPKTYSRVVRFTQGFNNVMSQAKSRLGHDRLIHDSDFYDHSHFIREFKQFTGYSPSQLPKESFFFAYLFTNQ